MLCGETVAVCCENRTEHTDALWAVRTTQGTHHVSTTEPNRLMLCGETVAVCCENRSEHTDTLWAICTSQETNHVSTTEPNRLMLCGETIAVCCENRTEHTDTLWAVRTSQGALRHAVAWCIQYSPSSKHLTTAAHCAHKSVQTRNRYCLKHTFEPLECLKSFPRNTAYEVLSSKL
jgi:hypothetical protein